ncbi:kinase-like domain-containing protein [Globomyces pollinis-pini]|nr:kinase-like domain-containing protein [Globomyces pollinis-pini]
MIQLDNRHSLSKTYIPLNMIGNGAFGKVLLAENIKSCLLDAIKVIPKSQIKTWASNEKMNVPSLIVPYEAYLLEKLNHPNIIQFRDLFSDDKNFYICMECPVSNWSNIQHPLSTKLKYLHPDFHESHSKDLFQFIELFDPIDESIVKHLFMQTFQAISYLHSLNIIHRDIKDQNILVDDHLNVKLIDFGNAIVIQNDKPLTDLYGTIQFCSPETLLHVPHFGKPTDIWAAGITLFLAMNRSLPFLDSDQVIHKQMDFKLNNRGSTDLKHLLSLLLTKEPTNRITIQEVISHPWLKGLQCLCD